jgi:transposase
MTNGSGLRRLCLGGRKGKRGPRTNNRRFLNALLWMARSGSRWRDLPRQLGRHEAVKRRYYRWIEMGVLDEILAALAREADLEWLMIDSTIVRAHQHAAGAGGCPGSWSLPRRFEHQNPRRGDALGNPVRMIGSPGQRNDIAFAHELVEGFAARVTIADKGYDADHLCDRIAQTGGQPVIPPKRNRTFKRPYDAELYKERNVIERFFNKLKHSRRVATRYDKLPRQLHELRQTRRYRHLAQIVKSPLRPRTIYV